MDCEEFDNVCLFDKQLSDRGLQNETHLHNLQDPIHLKGGLMKWPAKIIVSDVQFDGMELGLSVVVGFLIELAGRMARTDRLLLVFGVAGTLQDTAASSAFEKVQNEQQVEERKMSEENQTSKIRINTPILPARWRMLQIPEQSPSDQVRPFTPFF